MEATNIYLTSDENKALHLLKDEKSYRVIKRECNVSKGGCPSSELPVFIHNIKKKTGINDMRDPEQVKNYLDRFAESQKTPPSPEHLETMGRILGIGYREHTLEALANWHKITREEAKARYRAALHAIGIFTTDEQQQRVQMRIYFAFNGSSVRPLEPISERQWEALGLFAQGRPWEEITERLRVVAEKYAKEIIKNTCQKLGILAPGRGLQRRLAQMAIERHERAQQQATPAPEKSPDPMDDPMF